jgi:hypothetical protein
MYYNFPRIHQSLRVTPAMATGVTTRAWDVEDIVRLLENSERAARAAKDEQRYAWKGPALGH